MHGPESKNLQEESAVHAKQAVPEDHLSLQIVAVLENLPSSSHQDTTNFSETIHGSVNACSHHLLFSFMQLLLSVSGLVSSSAQAGTRRH